jgi:hypothetical protein
MEFGLTRTAQWCGGNRPCGWRTFADLLIGKDNQVSDGGNTDQQPGNQLAGYDWRIRSPKRTVPLAFYGQLIGEDEAGGLPAKFLGLLGLETWGGSHMGNWRLRAEYAGTACNFSREQPLYDCAYRNTNYPQGYTYRGRVIGHSLDNDSQIYTLGGSLVAEDGEVLSLALRRIEINRDGGGHAISSLPLTVDNVELRYSRALGAGNVHIGVGFTGPGLPTDSSSRVQGFVTWQQGF